MMTLLAQRALEGKLMSNDLRLDEDEWAGV